MFGQFQWKSVKMLRMAVIIGRVTALSASMYGTGYYCGVVDHISKPEDLEKTLMKDIFIQNGAKEVLPTSSKEVKQVSRIVSRVLPAAQTYCKFELQNAKTIFLKDFGQSFEIACESISEGHSSSKQASIDHVKHLMETQQVMQGIWKVVVLDSPLQNAFVSETFPRRIFVCKGLLDECKPTDEELALIIGHEISHLIHGHSSKSMLHGAFSDGVQLVLLALLDPTGITSVLWEFMGWVLSKSLSSSFSRQHETEADMTGIKIAAIACYDTKKGANIFAKLGKIPGSHQTTQWDDSHPSSPERFQALQKVSDDENWRKHMHCYPLLRNLEAIGIKFY